MQRTKHLFAEPPVEHWKHAHDSKYNLLLEVDDQNNRAGFRAFEIRKESDTQMKAILYVGHDQAQLNKIEKGLGETIAENSGFFRSFKLARAIKKEAALCGHMLTTEDPKMIDIMVKYIDSNYQFTSKDVNAIEKMTGTSLKNAI